MGHISKYSKETSTHNPLLIQAVLMSKGDVCELGSGFFSTPLLHWLCSLTGRNLVTYESDDDYYEFANKFRSRHHKIIKVSSSFEEIDCTRHWGVVLIDHSPKKPLRRGQDAVRLKNTADYIVLHDTEFEEEKHYGYDEMWPQFKYRHDWKKVKPFASVISNFKKLDNFK